jgi:hypothetical protein
MRKKWVVFGAFCSSVGYLFVHSNTGIRFSNKLFYCGGCRSELHWMFTRKCIQFAGHQDAVCVCLTVKMAIGQDVDQEWYKWMYKQRGEVNKVYF